jgi:FKBP-type peptidyl-prolyl cis-trans isomerase FkpA
MIKLLKFSCAVAMTSILLTGVAVAKDSNGAPDTEQEKLFYFMGTQLGQSLTLLQLSDAELDQVLRGARDTVQGNATELNPAVYGPKLAKLGEQRHQLRLEEERPKANAYLARMAAEDGATTTASGLVFLPLKSGTGATPTLASVVELDYHGTLRDGTVFDSSVVRGQAVQIPLARVHPCWQEGIAMLQAGGKAKITCPAKLAYQDRGLAGVPPGAAITFEVELVKIVK